MLVCLVLRLIFLFQILKRTEVVEETDSGCELVCEDESETADLWVERYKPKQYVELLSDEVSMSSTENIM